MISATRPKFFNRRAIYIFIFGAFILLCVYFFRRRSPESILTVKVVPVSSVLRRVDVSPIVFDSASYYRPILAYNLFRPLGWSPPVRVETYRLIGTRIVRDGAPPRQAILQTTARHQTYIDQEMESSGLGDLRLSALIPLLNASNADLILNAGVSIPTGAIDVEGRHGGDERLVLPYPMQLGSGSFELRPAVTFAGTRGSWSYGAEARAAIRLNDNSRNYRLAPTIGSTLWGARKLNDWLSISIRGSIENRGNITVSAEQTEMETSEDEHDHTVLNSHAAPAGATETLYMSPTMDPNLQGGTRANFAAGINFIVPDRFGSILAGQRLAVEFQMPVYENLDGPQMALGWRIVAGWQYAFGLW